MKKLSFNAGRQSNRYCIMNKMAVLGVFEWNEDNNHCDLVENYALPDFIERDLDAWVQSRFASKHRNHTREILQSCGLTTTRDVIDFFKGLSLTDTLWVQNENENFSWVAINLFNNEFSEVISKIAFIGGMQNIKFRTTSPELATDGMLEKCWVKLDDGIYLMKSGTSGFSNTGNEPLSENLASQVLTRLGYNHVNYSICQFRGRRVSKCKLFTSETEMLLPVYKALQFESFYGLQKTAERLGIADGLAQYLIFDYLSLNTDRHAGNIGCILDANTFELKGFSPIYDNGVGMLSYWNGHDDIYVYANDERMRPSLYDTFEEGAKWGKKILGSKHNVEKLIGFHFDYSQIANYSPTRVTAINEWLQTRVESFLEM